MRTRDEKEELIADRFQVAARRWRRKQNCKWLSLLICFPIIFDLLLIIYWIDPRTENRAGGMAGESKTW